MHTTIEIDPISGEEVQVLTGTGVVSAVRGAGAPLSGGWAYYLVEIHADLIAPHPHDLAPILTGVVAADDPVHLFAVDAQRTRQVITWRVEHHRLPNIPIDRPAADLELDVDTTPLLVGLDGAASNNSILSPIHGLAGEDL